MSRHVSNNDLSGGLKQIHLLACFGLHWLLCSLISEWKQTSGVDANPLSTLHSSFLSQLLLSVSMRSPMPLCLCGSGTHRKSQYAMQWHCHITSLEFCDIPSERLRGTKSMWQCKYVNAFEHLILSSFDSSQILNYSHEPFHDFHIILLPLINIQYLWRQQKVTSICFDFWHNMWLLVLALSLKVILWYWNTKFSH